MQHNNLTKMNAIHLHPNAIALWVENSAYIKEGLKFNRWSSKNKILDIFKALVL